MEKKDIKSKKDNSSIGGINNIVNAIELEKNLK